MINHRRGSSVTAMMLKVAIGPIIVMLVCVGASLYLVRLAELRGDIAERGHLLASMLAESCRYGVVSGSKPTLDLTLQGMVRADSSIESIQILSVDKAVLSEVQGSPHGGEPALTFVREIRGQKLEIDLLDQRGDERQLSGSEVKATEGAVVGYARVQMSTAPLEGAKRKYVYFTALMSLLGAVAAALFGLWQARLVREPLGRTIEALKALRQGRFDVSVSQEPQGELGDLERMVVDVAGSLAASTHRLEESVAQRTRELQQAIQRADLAHNEVRSLIARGNSQLEDERKRIAIELHDFMGSTLVALRLKAQHIAHLATLGPSEVDLHSVNSLAEEMAASIEGLYDKARQVIKQLRPEVLDTLGLRGALDEVVRDFDTLHPACKFLLIAHSDLRDVPADIAIVAYRLVQEALSNIVKHAQATQATISVERSSDPSELRIQVADNGRGFDPEALPKGRITLGLVGMRERVAAIGGTMTIVPCTPHGTSVEFRLRID